MSPRPDPLRTGPDADRGLEGPLAGGGLAEGVRRYAAAKTGIGAQSDGPGRAARWPERGDADAVDGALRALVGDPRYRRKGPAGDRYRGAVTAAYRAAYPGPYVPGSWGRTPDGARIEPAVGTAELDRILRRGTDRPGEPQADGSSPGDPANGPRMVRARLVDDAQAEGGANEFMPVDPDAHPPFPHDCGGVRLAAGRSFFWDFLRSHPYCAIDPSEPLPPLEPVLPDLGGVEVFPPREEAAPDDGQEAFPGGLPDIMTEPLEEYPDQSDDLPQGTILATEPGDRGGHLIYGGRTPVGPGVENPADRARLEGRDAGIRLSGRERAEFDRYLQGQGAEILAERERRDTVRIAPAQSYIWRQLRTGRRGVRTNGLSGRRERFYQWDYKHGEIEVYNGRNEHIGVLDPVTGEWAKPPKSDRTIKKDMSDATDLRSQTARPA